MNISTKLAKLERGRMVQRCSRPELPDDTLLEQLDLPTRISRVLQSQGLKTVREVRETSDKILTSFPDMGKGSVGFLREVLGLRSEDGVRCGQSGDTSSD